LILIEKYLAKQGENRGRGKNGELLILWEAFVKTGEKREKKKKKGGGRNNNKAA